MRPDVLPGCRCANEQHRRRFHDGGAPIALAREAESPRTGCVEREQDANLDPRPDEITKRRTRCH